MIRVTLCTYYGSGGQQLAKALKVPVGELVE